MRRAILIPALFCCAALGAQGMRSLQKHEFDYYQVIVDRLPFGDITEAPAAAVPLSVQQAQEQKNREEIAARLFMCGITITPQNELCAAFVDSTVSPAISYLLTVGESKNGFQLLAADRMKETATVLREEDGLELTFKLGKGLLQPEGDELAAAPPPVAAPATALRRALTPGSPGAIPAPTDAEPSFKERLAAREAAKDEAERTKKAAEDAARSAAMQDELARKAAELVAAEKRREEIERIKRGEEPSAPIKLTAEEDAELVREGVFDP